MLTLVCTCGLFAVSGQFNIVLLVCTVQSNANTALICRCLRSLDLRLLRTLSKESLGKRTLLTQNLL